MADRSSKIGDIDMSSYGSERRDWSEWSGDNYVVKWYDDGDLLFHDKLEDSSVLLDAEIVPDFIEQVLSFDPQPNYVEAPPLDSSYQGPIKIRYQYGQIVLTASESVSIDYLLAEEVVKCIQDFKTPEY